MRKGTIQNTSVTFQCQYSGKENEIVCISGKFSGKYRSLKMQQSSNRPDLWLMRRRPIPTSSIFRYDYLVLDKETNQLLRKETEHIIFPTGTDYHVSDGVLFPPTPPTPIEHTQVRVSVLSASLSPEASATGECYLLTSDERLTVHRALPLEEPDYVNMHRYDVDTLDSFALSAAVVRASGEVVARAHFHGVEMHDLQENVVRPFVSVDERLGIGAVIGSLVLRCVVIYPFVHAGNRHDSLRLHLQSEQFKQFDHTTIDIGHRGIGAQPRSKSCLRRAPIAENTLLGFTKAAELGADYVEFDVQMCRDGALVLHHDLLTPAPHGLLVPVCSLLGSQFLDLQKPQRNTDDESDNLVRVHSSIEFSSTPPSLPEKGSFTDTVYSLAVRDDPVTFEELLKRAPPGLGFDIEIKYASRRWQMENCIRFPERNALIDGVLQAIFDHGGNRRMFFSSFDPDVCMMLQQKQSKYPVFQLSLLGAPFFNSNTDVDHEDTRVSNLDASLHFALHENLSGLIEHTSFILAHPEAAIKIKHEHLHLFTYGMANADMESIRKQIEEIGVDAVISDNLFDVARNLGPSEEEEFSDEETFDAVEVRPVI
eukprot:gnl/Trimastix_PCT/3003.p1 GENE.gnl/Trimastix_PCT/3003~~gnl/Trimastix_PCT/3003.p1  ORF type:complete len:595 (-),score=159.20 gnl/Trimastix_PCT/3003:1334-3118(-)